MPKRWGMVYQGSKSSVAEALLAVLPGADVFVDLFAGGCAVSHCALWNARYAVKPKWRRVVGNDIKSTAAWFARLLGGGVGEGELYEPISREDFMARRFNEPKVGVAWSFGGGGDSYLWGRELEGVKLAAFKMLVNPDFSARVALYKEFCAAVAGCAVPLAALDGRNEALHRLRSMHLMGDASLAERYKAYEGDYEAAYNCIVSELSFSSESFVVYCDPPYCSSYSGGQDYAAGDKFLRYDARRFFRWVLGRSHPVFVSEYVIPDDFAYPANPDGLAEIWSSEKRVTIDSRGNSRVAIERLFVQRRYADEYRWQGELF